MKQKWWLIVLCLSGVLLARGQGVRRIGTSEGLMHPAVYAITQDPYGFVWLGTREGLYRFNTGRAVEISFLDSTQERRSRNIQSLLVSRDSTLWIGMQQGGVLAFDLRVMRPKRDEDFPQVPTSVTVQALYEDSYGNLWAGSAGQGLYRLDARGGQWVKMTYAPDPTVVDFVFDFAQQGDTLWLGTSGDRILYYHYAEGRIKTFVQGERYSGFRKMVDVQGGKVLVGITEQGVFLKDGDRFDFIQALNVMPRDVAFSGEDIWVSTDGQGVYFLQNGHWHRLSKTQLKSGLATDQFFGLHEVENEFWLGSFNDGVTVIPRSPGRIAKLENPENFNYNSIQSALSMDFLGEELWVGYDGDALARYKLEDGRRVPVEIDPKYSNLYPNVVTSLLADEGSQTLWAGTFNRGLFQLNAEGKVLNVYEAFTPGARGLLNNNIWSLAKGPGDSLWVGTLGGLQLWDGVRFVQPWADPWAVGRNIMDLEVDGDVLWVGTEFMGVFKIEGQAYTSLPLPYPILDVLALPSGGGLLAGTEGGGLFEWRDERWESILEGTLTTVYGLSCRGDSLYVASNAGLLLGMREEGEWQFSQISSLEESLLTLFNRKAILPDEHGVLIGGAGGVVAVDDKKAEESLDLLLVGARVDNNDRVFEVVSDSSEVLMELAPGARSVQFLFEIMTLRNQTGHHVEYRIEGWVPDWVALSPELKSLTLNNLRHGDFLLELRLVDEKGEVHDEVKLPWVVHAYFWQREGFKWLILLVLFMLAGAGVAFYQDRKLRTTRVKLLETERALLAAKTGELEAKAKQKSDELNFQLLKTSSRIELLQDFKDRLEQQRKDYKNSPEVAAMLQSMIRELSSELRSENYWDHFEQNYKDLQEAYSAALTEKYPKLTKGEIRLAYLIRQHMNNKEIATVLNVSPAAVEKAKYRLKKKMDLTKEDSLDDHIQGLE